MSKRDSPNVNYNSTAGGGAWKTMDGGHTWLPLFDLGSPTAPLRGGAIALNPADPTNVFYGTGESNNSGDSYAGTGVYESTDSGRTWTLITGPAGDNPIYGQSVSKIVIQPANTPFGSNNPLTVFAATSDFQVDASPAGAPGVWRFDGSWFNMTGSPSLTRATQKGQAPFDKAPPNTPGPDDDYRINFPQKNVSWTDLALVYFDPDVTHSLPTTIKPILYASMIQEFGLGGPNAGVYRSENPDAGQAGNGGIPFWYVGDSGATATAPTPKPDNRSSTEFPVGNNGRIQLTADPTMTATSRVLWSAATVYAAVSFPIVGASTDGEFKAIFFAGDSGKKWVTRPIPPEMADYQGPLFRGQGWYDTTITSRDALTVYVGGSTGGQFGGPLWQSLDGGITWTDISIDAAGNGPHADEHAMAIAANGDLSLGNDGGVWRFDPTTSLWSDINGTLAITTFNGLDVHPGDFTIAYGASQDNGTEKFGGNLAWTHVDDGDGGVVAVDPSNPNIVYHVLNGTIRKSTDAGATWNTIFQGSSLYFPFALDRINPQRLVTSDGAGNLFESLDGGASWNTIDGKSPNNYGGFNPQAAHDIALASFQGQFVPDPGFATVTDAGSNTYDPKTIYATDGSTVYVTKDDGLTWLNRGPQVTENFYTITFGAGVLKYKNLPPMSASTSSPGVYVTVGTVQDGSNSGSLTEVGNALDEKQTLEVQYQAGTTGFFSLTVTIPAVGAPYNTPASTFTISNIPVGVTAGALATLINAQLSGLSGNEVQLLQFANGTGTSTFTLTDGTNTTPAIPFSFNPAALAANINAGLAAATPAPMSGTASAVGGNVYITFGAAIVPLLVATGSSVDVFVKEVQQGGAASVLVGGSVGLTGAPMLTSIAVDPSNRDTVYATAMYGSNESGPTVFKSTDAGRTWADISGTGLPLSQVGTAQPVWTIVVDPRVNPATGISPVYVGTDVGVYASFDGGTTWAKFGAGMPNVQVKDLVLNQTLDTLSAGTYGRGMFQVFLDSSNANSGALRAVSGNSIWTGPVTLTGNTTIETDGTQNVQNGIAAASLNIIGTISDGGGNFTLTKIGQGTLILSGANTYGGQTLVNEGVVEVNNSSALGASAPAATANTVVADGAVLELATDLYSEPVTITCL
jgi:autotransporter-associated beta strand protein